MFLRTLVISMVLVVQQSVCALNVGGRTVTIDDWDSMSSKDRQSALNIYNNLNGTSLTEPQLRNKILQQSNKIDQEQIDNAVNNSTTTDLDTNSTEVRSVINDPANADLTQIQQNGNFTQEQINAQNQAQQEIAKNQEMISSLSNDVTQCQYRNHKHSDQY